MEKGTYFCHFFSCGKEYQLGIIILLQVTETPPLLPPKEWLKQIREFIFPSGKGKSQDKLSSTGIILHVTLTFIFVLI